MAFMTSEITFFEKTTGPIVLPFFFFVYFLPNLISESSNTTLSVFKEGAIEDIFRAKILVLIDFLFVVYLLFILYA